MAPSDSAAILAYHQATKHHFGRYARSAGYMDWANQPNPFRSYEDLAHVALPLPVKLPELRYEQLYAGFQTPPSRFNRESVSAFLLYALGLSAWKSDGSGRWPLRINPSSGNLHPTEGYLITPELGEIAAGIYHYNPLEHALERRALLSKPLAGRLETHLGGRGFCVALSSIFWRESWKYGERAFRYCQLDLGHALAALAMSARLNGWRLSIMGGIADDKLDTMLGFDRTAWLPLENEVVEVLCRVSPVGAANQGNDTVPEDMVSAFAELKLDGRPNRLSHQPVDWPIITKAARAVRKPATEPIAAVVTNSRPSVFPPPASLSAVEVLCRRRSAVAYDPDKTISAGTLFAILERVLPDSAPPFESGLAGPNIDLIVFVHHVVDIEPGLYLLARRPESAALLRSLLHPGFEWSPVVADLPFYLLKAGDMTHEAAILSCHQAIAGDSALAFAMLADFKNLIDRNAFTYRYLHWECGMIGQILYLEAEAQGLRGTGIGCYFDDEVHRLLGLTGLSHQVLYHFTLGHPVEDKRLTTLPPYHHRGVF